ncbi:glucuronyl esterase domain-containing protein [Asticcacaulis solisilvae]|uniref:glucuronyl esterase domain-containing protein n=1 Tax=Asticcacaulis solisilvae TaxID=1217274 RepID=UPI003FD889CC
MRTSLFALALGFGMIALPSLAQAPKPPVTFTAEQDHQNMMDQLHITSLRPGPSGDESAPNAANTDEAKANPYPDWPDILTLKNGRKVTTADDWWKLRRPEIVEDFEREVIGRQPADTPKVTWAVAASEMEFVNFKPVMVTKLVGHVDNSAYPLIDVNIDMMLILPADAAKKPVPVLIMFNWGPPRFPAPMQPQPADMARINAALKAELVARDPGLADVFASHPAYDLVVAAPFPPPPGSGPDERIQQLLADGWGVAVMDPTSVQADNGAGLTRGIIGLVNEGQPRKPDDWGALRAWGWGASRVLDYLATRPEVDAKHVGIEGVSRYGKAALVTMDFDQRFAFVLVGSSGEGGAKPHRRNFGEAVESLTGTGEYHWMAGNFLKYGGPKTPGDLPVDSHELIALAAPRPTFISYGVPEKGDARWLDQQGSYMATVAAGRVWTLLGAKDLGVGNDYKTVKMPPVLNGLLDGQLAWRQHDGGHTDAPNMKSFILWADRQMGRASQIK